MAHSNKFNKLVHWNIRGLLGNLEELQVLSREESPAVFALQETLLKPNKNISLSGYKHIKQPAPPTENDGFSGGGVLCS